jgi:hypothetical protein
VVAVRREGQGDTRRAPRFAELTTANMSAGKLSPDLGTGADQMGGIFEGSDRAGIGAELPEDPG